MGLVAVTLQAVGQTIVMAGHKDPRRSYNQRELDPLFHDFLHSYKVEDDPSIPQLAIPIEMVEFISCQWDLE